MSKQANSIAVNSFDLNHNNYHLLRPSFAEAIVNPFLVGLNLAEVDSSNTYKFHTNKKILEIAAGTGKFTKNLVENGWDNSGDVKDNLIIVEPSAGMLESFKNNFPQIKSENTYQASSYHIPLEDNSVDSVIIAQGFHWFADSTSLKEINRVLKPSGTFGLIWNADYPTRSQAAETENVDFINGGTIYFDQLGIADSSPVGVFSRFFDKQPWSKKVCELIYTYDKDVPQYRKGDWREALSDNQEYFRKISQELFLLYDTLIPRKDVYKYWETRSYITNLSSEEKSKIKHRVEEILENSVVPESVPYESSGDKRLLKPMATHAVVLHVK